MVKLMLFVALLSVLLIQLHAMPAINPTTDALVVANEDPELSAAVADGADLKTSESLGFGFYPGLPVYGGFAPVFGGGYYGGGYGGGYGYGYRRRWGFGGYGYRHNIFPAWG